MRLGQMGAWVLALTISLSTPGLAGDSGPGNLPEGVTLGISIRSPDELMAAMDAGYVAATRNTLQPREHGVTKALSQLYGGYPMANLKSWRQDREAFIFVAREPLEKLELAFVFSTPSFNLFIEDLRSRKYRVMPDTGHRCELVAIPRFGVFLADGLGEDLTVLATSPGQLDRIRDAWSGGWRPRHWARGVVGAELAPSQDWRQYNLYLANAKTILETIIVSLEEKRRDLAALEEADLPSLDERFSSVGEIDNALGMVDLLLAAVPALSRELDGVERITLDAGTEGDAVAIGLAMTSSPETYAAAMAARTAGRGNVDIALAAPLGDDAPVVIMHAAAGDALPNLEEIAARATAIFANRVQPNPRGASGFLARKFIEHNLGAGAIAFRKTEKSAFLSSRMLSLDSDTALRTWIDTLDFSNAAADELHRRSDKQYVKFAVSDERTPDGVGYSRVTITPQSLRDVVESRRAESLKGVLKVVVEGMSSFSALFAARGPELYAVAGIGDNDELIGALRSALVAPDSEPEDSPRRKAAAPVARSQNMLILFALDRLLVTPMLSPTEWDEMTEAASPGSLSETLLNQSLLKAGPAFRKSGELSALAFGGEEGSLTAELRIPFDSLNAAYGNHLLYVDQLRKDLKKKFAEERGDVTAPLDDNIGWLDRKGEF